ncbi:MAG: hypothetical protein JNK54_06225 [Elusimicrobia bacterium]|nr:hypothetical protein [Elusimicrobiota bacterium]
MNALRQKRSRWGGALPVVAAAFLPVFVHGLDRSNDDYRLRDDVNVGGVFYQTGGGLNLHGTVSPMETTLSGIGSIQLAPGPHQSFYYPKTISDFGVTAKSDSTLALSWTAPSAGVDYVESVSSYDIRYSQSPLNETNFDSGLRGPIVTGKPAGFIHEAVELPGLSYDTPYYVGIASIDHDNPGNKSFSYVSPPVRTLAKTPSNPVLSVDVSRSDVILAFNPENPDGHDLSFEAVITRSNINPPVDIIEREVLASIRTNSRQSLTFSNGNLNRNVRYYVYLRVFNGSNFLTSWIDCGSTVIASGLPSLSSVTLITSSSLTVNWIERMLLGKYQAHLDTVENFSSPNHPQLPNPPLFSINSQAFTSLKGNTTYYYKVSTWDFRGRALEDTGTGDVVTSVSKPVNVLVGEPDVFPTRARITWSMNPLNDAGPHSYEVTLSTTPSFDNPSYPRQTVPYLGSNSMSVEFTGLISNAPHYVWIRGKNRAGAFSSGADIYDSGSPLFYTLPNAPQVSLSVPDFPSRQVGFTVETMGNHSNTRYEAKLYGSPNCTGGLLSSLPTFSAGSASSVVRLFENTSGNIFIPANALYSVCVTALKADPVGGAHAVSDPRSSFTAPIQAQRGPVFYSLDTLTITWSDVENAIAKNAPATVYHLDWRLERDSDPIDSLSISGPGPFERSATSLQPNTTYQFKMSVSTPSGSSWPSLSNSWEEVTLAKEPLTPSFTLYTTSMTARWESHGNPDGTLYRVDVDTDSRFGSIDVFAETKNLSVDLLPLVPNTTYFAQVRAINHGNQLTVPVAFPAGESTRANPIVLEQSNLTLLTDSGTMVWGANGNPIGTRYVVSVAENESMNSPILSLNVTQAGDTNSEIRLPFGPITPNKNYFVRVDVHGHSGEILRSNTVNNRTAAAVVPILSFGAAGADDPTKELKLVWDKTVNDSLTKYVLELSTSSGFEPGRTASFTTAAGEGSHVFKTDVLGQNLSSNQLYYTHVRAEEGAVFSIPSDAYTFPSSPINLMVLDPSDPRSRVKFGWDHGNNAPERTQYEISVSTTVDGIEHIVVQKPLGVGVHATEISETEGLVWANQKYVVNVRALAAGAGIPPRDEWITSAAFTAPLAPKLTVDRPPVVTTNTILVKWSAPTETVGTVPIRNRPGTEYQVEWDDGRSFKRLSGFEYLLPDLTPNTTYNIKVKAVRAIGSVWPEPEKTVVEVTRPNQALFLLGGITVYSSSVTLSWGLNGNSVGTNHIVTIFDSAHTFNYSTRATRFTTPPDLQAGNLYSISVAASGHKYNPEQAATTISRRTLPLAPRILSPIEKPESDSTGQKVEVHWDPESNGLITVYNASKDNGLTWSSNSYAPRHLFESLLPNTLVNLLVRSNNGFDEVSPVSSTQVWTRASVPRAPSTAVPLLDQVMGIGFPDTNNPPYTEYAVQLATEAEAVAPFHEQNRKYAELESDGSPGLASFTSVNPVWLTATQWVSSGRLLLRNLPEDSGYKIVLYSRNQQGESEGPGEGLSVKPSAGVPLVTLPMPNGGIETHLTSWEKKVYFNSTQVPFQAANSSHFNVIWSNGAVGVDGSNLSNSQGWNGKIDALQRCLSTGGINSPRVNDALKGFCAPEGLFYLNSAGTAVINGALDLSTIFSTVAFRVYIDTTPPKPEQLAGFFSVGSTETLLSQDTIYGDPDPYFSWASTDTIGNRISRSPILGWTYSVSSDTAVTPERSTQSPQFLPFRATPGVEVDFSEITQTTTFYFKVRGYDQAGNWTSNDHLAVFRYTYTPDQILPRWNNVSLSGKRYPPIDETLRYAAVNPTDQSIPVEFSEAMIFGNNAIQLSLVRGPDGRRVESRKEIRAPGMSNAIVANSSGAVILPFLLTNSFLPGSAYRFFTSTSPSPTDNANNALENKLSVLFYTAMDPATPAVFVSEDDVAWVEVSPYALGRELAGMAINDRPDMVSVAGSPGLPGVLDKANGALSRGPGGAYRNLFAAKELSVFSTNGELRTQPFAGAVQLFFSYEKWPLDAQGRIVGSAARPKDLAIFELDEQTGFWNKMPNSQVDETRKVVSTPLRHNATYGLRTNPNYDLTEAHPYPVPYRPAQDKNGITFTGLSSFGTIKIFTLDGRLVKTLPFENVSFIPWNPVASDSGEPVGSDVYLYMIENEQQRVVGKLMVIR